jgi:NADPH2:quinone reductase
MRAITVSEYGAAPAVTELPDPKAGPGQILVKIRAAGVNPMDRAIAEGQWQSMMPAVFPLILGADLAGVVEAVGEQVSRFSPGDEVFGQLLIPPLGSAGTYAEHVSVTQDAPLARVPRTLETTTAAALPTAGGTALNLVEALGELTGKTMLIVGAAGGVGTFATQLAAQAGARVIASARSSDAARVRGYGAVETIDYDAVALPESVSTAHPEGIDVLVDLASDPAGFAALAAQVRPGGTALTTRYLADIDSLAAAGVNGINFQVSMSTGLLEHLADAVASGGLVPPPITTVQLRDVPVTWEQAGEGYSGGKVVVIP